MDMLSYVIGKKQGGGGGDEPTGTKEISITQNGTTTENIKNYASAEITVNVANSYTAGDEGKVVSSGALVSQTAHADVTPTTSDQTIDTTTNNSIKVKGDADLVAGNIKKDVEIFGVTGSYEGGGGGIDLFDPETPSGAITSSVSGTTKSYACAERSAVTSIHLTNAESLGAYSIRNNSSLTTVVGEKVTSCGSYGIAGNSSLTVVDILARNTSSAAALPNNAFNGNSSLTTIVLRGSYIITLNHTGAFTGTPFANGGTGGTIYIPKSLYDQLGTGTNDYQSASNWSTVYGYGTITWAKIEGSYYETHYADGTVIS